MMKKRLLIATRNLHKAQEIGAILGAECWTLRDLEGAPPVKEDRATFTGNAQVKAESLARWIRAQGVSLNGIGPTEGLMILADDSGLEVDALNGAPGVHSARFAGLDKEGGGNSSDEENNAKLLRLLKDTPRERRGARFRCVLAMIRLGKDHEETEFFDGTCDGRIETAPRGAGGFGYDPLFVPTGHERSFGEMSEEEKNRISHRAKALERLRVFLSTRE